MQLLAIYFILSMFITLLIMYIIYPAPKIILKEPNIKEPMSNLYIDKNRVCYRYHRKEINCPK